jgi:hypothetical protein
MKRTNPAPEATVTANPWLDQAVDPETPEVQKEIKATKTKRVEAEAVVSADYDMEGLMTDFPTAKDLERFVYDQTGYVLNLKGRANKLKYQVAMDALNGKTVDPQFVGADNPYIERADLIPVEDMKPTPDRDPSIPERSHLQNEFVLRTMPHPDADFRALDRKVDCVFRKYRNGMISYEVMGPIDQRPMGEKMDKFGRMRPEIIKWVDPRTGEQVVVRKDGTMTPMGRNLRAIMQRMRINNSNFWDAWVDREFVSLEGGELRNPWGAEE